MPIIALTAKARDLQWAPADGGAAVQAAGTLSVQGLPDDWRAILDTTLVRDGEQATLRATGQGDTERQQQRQQQPAQIQAE